MRQDARHHAFRFQEVKTVQQQGEVGGGLGGRKPWLFKRSQQAALRKAAAGCRSPSAVPD
jgi:hypothetical protein